jgi:hypothetical protein
MISAVFWVVMPCSFWEPDALEEHNASILWIEKEVKEELLKSGRA